jgi:cobalt-zinc-cadmium efflux system protein
VAHSHTHGGDDGHGGSAAARNQRALAIVLGLTSVYVLAEVLGGLVTGSLALLADAGHTLTDVLGMAMALAAIWFAKRPATASRTYGFYRAEVLAALVNSIIPFGIAAYILYEAWHRLYAPLEIHSLPMLGVAFAGVVINLIGVRLLQSGAAESLNLRAAFLEVLADLIGSAGVIVAALVILLTGWKPADLIISVAIGLFILPRTWHLLIGVVDVLLEATPKGVRLDQIEASMSSVPGVSAVHELHVWTITSGFVAMSAHVETDGRESSDTLHDLQRMLQTRFNIEHATLQIERPGHIADGVCCTIDPRCVVLGPSRLLRPLGSHKSADAR